MNREKLNFKTLKSEKIFEGVVFNILVETIEYDSGNRGVRETVLHNGGSVIVPITNEGKVVLVTQYRHPLKKYLLELPAGKLEKNEEPLECAKRELSEETGYVANNIIKVGQISTSPGFCTEILHIFLARNLTKKGHKREEGEYGMNSMELTFNEINNKIASGEIYDAKTICGIYMAQNNFKL